MTSNKEESGKEGNTSTETVRALPDAQHSHQYIPFLASWFEPEDGKQAIGPLISYNAIVHISTLIALIKYISILSKYRVYNHKPEAHEEESQAWYHDPV